MTAPADSDRALKRLVDTTVERQALLAELMASDPGAVLRTAIPERIRNTMPAEIRPFIERRVELEGELKAMYEDFEDGSHRLTYTLMSGNERISLHFRSSPPYMTGGSLVAASGIYLGAAVQNAANAAMALDTGGNMLKLALDGGENQSTDAVPPPVANSFGEQRTAVILVNFETTTSEPWTVAEANNIVFGDVDAFFRENSQDRAWLSGDVFGWFTLQLDPTGCPSSDIT